MFLSDDSHTYDGITQLRNATLVEITLTSPAGEPKSIRNVLLSQPVERLAKPSGAVWLHANRFDYDRCTVQAWLDAQPVQAEGIAIDERTHEWTDPILQPA